MILATCRIDRDRLADMAALRAAHIQHVLDNRDVIHTGGLTTTQSIPTAIVLLLDVATRQAAETLVAADPYSTLYSDVELTDFTLRIPEPEPGSLEHLRDAAAREQRAP
ncbi:MAG: hypothetical protein R2698_04280 [Microthrixaceae bacterium]